MILVALCIGGIVALIAWGMYLGIRLPVSRTAYDDMVRIADMEREHNRKLTRIILRLKVRQEAHLPPKGSARREQEQDQIELAISRSKHAKNPAIRTALSNFAEEEKLKGTPVSEIIQRLLNWDRIRDDELKDREEEEDDSLLS